MTSIRTGPPATVPRIAAVQSPYSIGSVPPTTGPLDTVCVAPPGASADPAPAARVRTALVAGLLLTATVGGLLGTVLPASPATACVVAAQQGQLADVASPPLLQPGTRVLMVGDSHTVGAFGTELDRLVRTTGVQLETYGSAGSSPSWWMDGHETHSGFVARHADGTVEQPWWQDPHATPKLASLLDASHPQVLVVNLGANFRKLDTDGIRAQVALIGDLAREHDVRLVWVGPPLQQSDEADHAAVDAFYAQLAADVAPYGTLVDSRPLTPHYAGSDGLHYNGPQGTELARQWARGVFDELQSLPGAPAGQ